MIIFTFFSYQELKISLKRQSSYFYTAQHINKPEFNVLFCYCLYFKFRNNKMSEEHIFVNNFCFNYFVKLRVNLSFLLISICIRSCSIVEENAPPSC